MSKDRTTPRPAFAAGVAYREAMRQREVMTLREVNAAQAAQIRSLRASLAASMRRANQPTAEAAE